MLTYRLLHPGILRALGEAGHGDRVLIADGNYPLGTRTHERARRVYLNLAPDLLRVTDVLAVLAEAIPIEAAHVMTPESGEEPAIFAEFRSLLPGMDLSPLSRFLGIPELGQGAASVRELQHRAVESLDLQQQQLGVLAGLDGDLLGGLTQP